ncbi:MAG TPA: Re/Si-specific NAD(P)(+) transhydrogenase subunit alpha [Longimicrobiales bacterium]|nr:Re/Si-specific NAD(P)(+) transhydrogenase subunit alpha [Longimicrobiales bacterium]
MKVGVPKEVAAGERRVALVPESAGKLAKAGLEVIVEAGAGTEAGFADGAYIGAGATVVPSRRDLFTAADVVLTVKPPAKPDLEGMRPGSALIGLLNPFVSPELVSTLADGRVTSFAMELVPRITRAQKMDALSSQATAAGYKAVLIAASTSGKFFPMLMTAAGTIPPAKVLVLGAGVAGLQAIATARRLGAVVQGYDIRPETKEQVESLGATFVGQDISEGVGTGGYAKEVSEETKQQQRAHLAKLVREADVVITTANVPGKQAPVLISEDMLADMKPGSVIVDLAADSGGNCAVTRAGETIEHNGIYVLGPRDLPATMPVHASAMYSRNIVELLNHLVKDGQLNVDTSDEITRECLVTQGGEVVHARLAATAGKES